MKPLERIELTAKGSNRRYKDDLHRFRLQVWSLYTITMIFIIVYAVTVNH